MTPSWKLLLSLAGPVFLASALPIVSHFTQPSDIWWTPKEMGPSLTDVADRVEVYVRGRRLDEQVKAGRLLLLGSDGTTTVTASDLRFRFNNVDRVRAQEIPILLAAAACAGASCVGLFLGFVGWRRERAHVPPS